MNIRKVIREELIRLISESEPLVNPKPVNLKDNSKEQNLGDPLEDVKLNTMIGKAQPDKNIVGVVGVKSGAKKGGSDELTGQPKANFATKKDVLKSIKSWESKQQGTNNKKQ